MKTDTAIGVSSRLLARFRAVTTTSSRVPLRDSAASSSAFAITTDGNSTAAARPNFNDDDATFLMPPPPYIDYYDQYIALSFFCALTVLFEQLAVNLDSYYQYWGPDQGLAAAREPRVAVWTSMCTSCNK